MAYVTPSFKAGSFTCPHCEAITGQTWPGSPTIPPRSEKYGFTWSVCQADGCQRPSLWVGIATTTRQATKSWVELKDPLLVWPSVRMGPAPNPDLDQAVQKDFQEARAVLPYSPRAAAALLRLALQKLMIQLGEFGKNINDDIGSLVDKGLRPDVQQAADVVRVTGNDAVHPGEINTDDEATVLDLFDLLNVIAEDRITQPAKVKSIYDRLPESKRDGVTRRDGGQNSE